MITYKNLRRTWSLVYVYGSDFISITLLSDSFFVDSTPRIWLADFSQSIIGRSLMQLMKKTKPSFGPPGASVCFSIFLFFIYVDGRRKSLEGRPDPKIREKKNKRGTQTAVLDPGDLIPLRSFRFIFFHFYFLLVRLGWKSRRPPYRFLRSPPHRRPTTGCHETERRTWTPPTSNRADADFPLLSDHYFHIFDRYGVSRPFSARWRGRRPRKMDALNAWGVRRLTWRYLGKNFYEKKKRSWIIPTCLVIVKHGLKHWAYFVFCGKHKGGGSTFSCKK